MQGIIVTKPGTLTAADRKALRDAGVVCIVAANPRDVRYLQPEGPPLGADDLFVAAMRGVGASEYSQKAFAVAVAKLVDQRSAK